MENMLDRVVQSVQKSSIAFSKYITANDVGATGAHQAGFHIQKKYGRFFLILPVQKEQIGINMLPFDGRMILKRAVGLFIMVMAPEMNIV